MGEIEGFGGKCSLACLTTPHFIVVLLSLQFAYDQNAKIALCTGMLNYISFINLQTKNLATSAILLSHLVINPCLVFSSDGETNHQILKQYISNCINVTNMIIRQ